MSLEAVGNVPLLAPLITPAETARLLTERLGPMALPASAYGCAGSLAGLRLLHLGPGGGRIGSGGPDRSPPELGEFGVHFADCGVGGLGEAEEVEEGVDEAVVAAVEDVHPCSLQGLA